jgi:O-antigen ligase
METLSFFALIYYLAVEKRAGPFYHVPGMVPLLCIGLYHLVQIVPFPAGLVALISPETYRLHELTGDIAKVPDWISLTVRKKGTVSEFFRFAAAAAFYVLTVQLFSQKEMLKKTITILTAFCGFLAFLSIIQYLFSNHKIYWIRKLTQAGSPFGPFVNRNHYAGFIGMVFPVVLGLFLFYKPRVSYASLREKMLELFSRRGTNMYILIGLALVLMAVSVFLSLSRSGIVSLGLSITFFGLMLFAAKTGSRRWIVIVIICILILLSVGWFGWDPIIARFEKIRNPLGNIADLRPTIWKDTLPMIRDFPVFGTGFDTYIDAYTKYRTLPGEAIVDHAHNDYLELLSDGGLIGFLLFAWYFAAIGIRSFRTFRKRNELYSIYIFIGSVSGIVYMLLHSVTDFNLHIGSNGLYFFFLAGIMVSSAHTRMRDGLVPTFLKPVERPPLWGGLSPSVLLLISLLSVLLMACLVFNFGAIIGKYYYSSLKNIRLDQLHEKKDLLLVQDTVQRAIMFDPLEPDYRLSGADIEMKVSGPAVSEKGYRQVIAMAPFNAGYVQGLGLAFSEMNEVERSERLLKLGITLDRNGSSVYKTYALWLLAHDRKAEGMANIKTALSIAPGRTREYITLMVLNRLSNEEIAAVMPDLVQPHLTFADFLFKTVHDDMASEEYRRAFDFIGNEKEVFAGYFFQASGYFMKKEMYDDAIMIMRKGTEALPDSIELRLAFGEIYEKMGMVHRAVEEYEKALVIDPDNIHARRRIDAVQ